MDDISGGQKGGLNNGYAQSTKNARQILLLDDALCGTSKNEEC